ncbi:MAG TPA: hypothetical protein VJ085_02245, partial [Candidatus Acidoferrales bacterium]|nr:hypothetical protein [Candidatus Acidoferrales bacterium]
MHGRTKAVLLLAALVLLTAIFLQGSIPAVVTGTWGSAGSMSAPRDGASAALLADGRVLIAGGQDGSGPMAGAEFFGSNGSFSLAPPMHMARSGHSATLLADGRMLVAGGVTLGEGPTNAVEIYDPASDSWSFAGSLLEARAGHTATRLEDGRVLIAGGGRATLEIYDPERDSFSYAGSLSAPRSGHAAATLARWPAQNNRLIDRQVIFVGGSDGSNVLSSTEIYDPATGQVSAGPALPGPRQNASAVTVLGGYVYVAGGNDGSQDLSSALLISRDGEVSAAADLLSPRSGHIAVRLPGNNSVLIAGGSGGSSAEIYIPWLNEQVATGSMSAPHSGGASASAGRGLYLAAGGSGSSSAELYGYATVETDKNDYAPGETVTITGSGWAPGETVTLVLSEDLAEPFHGDRELTAIADAYGNIFDASFAPEEHDLGVRFFLTASGERSQARTTFTDGTPGAPSLNPATVSVPSTGMATTEVSVTYTGTTDQCTVTFSISFTAPAPAGVTTAFNPTSVSGGNGDTKTTELKFTTSSTTPGSYPFSVTRTRTGSGCGGATNSSTDGTLIVFGDADHLAFLQQPTNTVAGASITPAVTVRVLDAGNRLVAN